MSTRPKRKPTATSNFGAGRRESHDSSAFYERFTSPEISDDDEINPLPAANRILVGDAASTLQDIPANCVALVVTSPPYFVGKEYEQALGEGHVPETYLEYLGMLEAVFRECVRVLEPGGRIAVNVANLGRKPYRSLSADVIRILQDDLKLLLRGEIIWKKAEGATGSTAWGSFQSAANPTLRDLTERVIVASKGRFDRARPRPDRADQVLPYLVTVSKDEFMEATLDVWDIPPESAKRVGHPAPFPVELPKRLIELYTYEGDVVLDPFFGSGSTGVAAVETRRRWLGCEVDPQYRDLAEQRVREAQCRLEDDDRELPRVTIALPGKDGDADDDFQARAVRDGKRAREIAKELLIQCGFSDIEENRRLGGGVEVNFVACDADGRPWYFDVSGAFTSSRPGLRRTDTLWKALGKAAVLRARSEDRIPFVLLTTHLPPEGTAGFEALEAARGFVIHDAVQMLGPEGISAACIRRLTRYARGKGRRRALGTLSETANG